MPLKQRRAVLQSFRNDSTVSCILLSLKAGGEGLNLQAASHVMVLEPWWNPAVESQAIQRAHRIGQTKRVKAVRFCVEDTIEEKMLQLQEKKQLAFDGCVDGSVQSLAQLTGEDLGFLFKR
jgi:DNA repair protein RAD16